MKTKSVKKPKWWREGDWIVTAFAKYCEQNTPIILVVHNKLQPVPNAYRVEYIQPEDQTYEMLALFDVSAAANVAMINAVHKAGM